MIKEILKEIMKKEDEIIKNMKNKAVFNVDFEINGKTWRMKTEYTRDRKTGGIMIKDYPMILLTGGTE
jgi:DNA repair exonuclease SbcCD ATPase subunit